MKSALLRTFLRLHYMKLAFLVLVANAGGHVQLVPLPPFPLRCKQFSRGVNGSTVQRQIMSVLSRSVVSDSLQPHRL